MSAITTPRDIVLQDPSCPWARFGPPDIQHCEANVCGWITTPANTWSNLAFFVAAWYLFKRGKQFDRWFAWASIGMGACSFALHASFSWWGQYLDYLGMYPYTGLMVAINLKRLGVIKRWRPAAWAMVAGSIAATPLVRVFGIGIQYIMIPLIVGAMLTEIAAAVRGPKADYRPFLVGAGLTFAGIGVWLLDFSRFVCQPDNHVFQLHALWHCMAALGVPFVAAFYGSLALDE